MKYTIAAIPTRYNGVQFRSRLEARWAAFFDIRELKWIYEPFDLNGWAPDFLINTPFCNVLVEVKPVSSDKNRNEDFKKAVQHWKKIQVLLCGVNPRDDPPCIGIMMDAPVSAQYSWVDVWNYLNNISDVWPENISDDWNEAGNVVQWLPKT